MNPIIDGMEWLGALVLVMIFLWWVVSSGQQAQDERDRQRQHEKRDCRAIRSGEV